MLDNGSSRSHGDFRGSDPRPSTIARFWKYVDKSAPDACWEWRGGKDKNGYGLLGELGRNWRAHRLSYVIHRGDIPPGMYVLHSCDNPPCCNPAHLRLGTQRDNGADMKARGRCKGNGYHRRVHSDEVIREIRRAVADGASQKNVAERFGISYAFVNALVNGRRRVGAGGPMLKEAA